MNDSQRRRQVNRITDRRNETGIASRMMLIATAIIIIPNTIYLIINL